MNQLNLHTYTKSTRSIRFSALLLLLLCCLGFQQAEAQSVQKIEPPNWWKGFSFDTVQLMVYGKSLSGAAITCSNPGVEVVKIHPIANSDYLIFTVKISLGAQEGKTQFTFKVGKKNLKLDWMLSGRVKDAEKNQGLHGADVVYLIMPDRFANGNPANDSVTGYAEGVKRSNPNGRHGGDVEGITKNLDYLQKLGVTALWLTPVYANNQKAYSYHGYSITDFYQTDARFGGNNAYRQLVNIAHSKGMKIVKDMVFNHIGTGNPWYGSWPDKNWVNMQDQPFTRTNYKISAITDPHGSKDDKHRMLDGWFDVTMPDLNQKHPLVATYLIQQTLWWLQEFGLDGLRIDTYPYPELDMMNDWVTRVTKEFPGIYIVGEVWVNHVTQMAYYVSGEKGNKAFPGNLPAGTDFPLAFAIAPAMNEKGGWDKGLAKLYETLSQDFMYPKPESMLLFGDNHDMSRMYLTLNRNLASWKMAVAFMLTTKRIPQFYYGVECLWDGDAVQHPNVRLDFPGGWAGDKVNYFTETGLSADQKEAYTYLKTLLNWRKTKDAIKNGRLLHFAPENNIYVYFRISSKETLMVVMNGNEGETEFDLNRFQEGYDKFTSGVNMMTGLTQNLSGKWKMPGRTAWILELK